MEPFRQESVSPTFRSRPSARCHVAKFATATALACLAWGGCAARPPLERAAVRPREPAESGAGDPVTDGHPPALKLLVGDRPRNLQASPPQPSDSVIEEDTSSAAVGQPVSEPLSCGLHNPMPGGFAAGYAADTGLDIAGMRMPVFAIGSGRVVYAESGHSLWSGRGDTDLAILIQLDEPLDFDGRKITHVWYAHLLEMAFEQPRESGKKRRRVKAGEYLGINGRANGMWHLHLGLLLDGDTTQGWGTFLLEDDVRKVLCGVRAKQRFPDLPKKKR